MSPWEGGSRVLRSRAGSRLDLDDGGTPQAQRGIRGHCVALDLIPIQPQHLEPGVVHHIHDSAETADGEFCRGRKAVRAPFYSGSESAQLTQVEQENNDHNPKLAIYS